MKPMFFAKQSELRKWFEKNYKKEAELLVGFYKVSSGKPSITWSESVDEALCFGWIDGVRRSIDEESYCIRFTPRKASSNWSAVNIKKVEELTRLGLMKPEGLEAFNKRQDSRSKIYSYENEPVKLDKKFEKQFQANKKAWTFFNSLPPSYRKVTINWVMSAKQQTTRESRLKTLIDDSEAGLRIKQLRYSSKK